MAVKIKTPLKIKKAPTPQVAEPGTIVVTQDAMDAHHAMQKEMLEQSAKSPGIVGEVAKKMLAEKYPSSGEHKGSMSAKTPNLQSIPKAAFAMTPVFSGVSESVKPLGQFEMVKNQETGNEFYVLGRSGDGYALSFRMELKHGQGTMLEFRVRIGDRDPEPLNVDDLDCPLDLEAISMGGKGKNYRSISGLFQSSLPPWDTDGVLGAMAQSGLADQLHDSLRELFPTIMLEDPDAMPKALFQAFLGKVFQKLTADMPKPSQQSKNEWRFGLHPVIIQYPPKKQTMAQQAGL